MRTLESWYGSHCPTSIYRKSCCTSFIDPFLETLAMVTYVDCIRIWSSAALRTIRVLINGSTARPLPLWHSVAYSRSMYKLWTACALTSYFLLLYIRRFGCVKVTLFRIMLYIRNPLTIRIVDLLIDSGVLPPPHNAMLVDGN